MTYRSKPLPEIPNVWRELQRVGEAFDVVHDFDVLQVLPDKPREGMQRYFAADVVSSGSSKGPYIYNGTEWKFMCSTGNDFNWVHISTTTATEERSKEITGLTGYDVYMLEFEQVKIYDTAANTQGAFSLQVGTGTSFYSGLEYSWLGRRWNENIAVSALHAEQDSSWEICGSGNTGETRNRAWEDFYIPFSLFLYNLNDASNTQFTSSSSIPADYGSNGVNPTAEIAHGIVRDATVRNSVKIFTDTMDFSGSIHLYGRTYP